MASAALVAVVGVTGCGGSSDTTATPPTASVPSSISVTSTAFHDGAQIPTRYTCDGRGAIVPLRWSKPPDGTKDLAVLVDDPDAPGGTYTHWILLDLPAKARAVADRETPGAHEAKNSAGSAGWTPPCPPKGDSAHHYRFTVYALRSATGLGNGASIADARAAIDKLAFAKGTLVGRYARAG